MNTSSAKSPGKMPVIFLAHGAPILLDDELWCAQLRDWADSLPRPKDILMISAHWVTDPVELGATKTAPLVYDFYGFPDKYYQTQYPAPGSPELAEEVRALLDAGGIEHVESPQRGLDHGAYIPLVVMYPEADIPVLQLSLPGLAPGACVELGRALAPLRKRGTLIIGSGFITHNMRYAMRSEVQGWAIDFDEWARGAIENMDIEALANLESVAPQPRMALPTTEHYLPLLVAAGAAGEEAKASFPITGWAFGPFTKRSVEFR